MRRRGKTLIEMMIVISIASVAIALATKTIAHLMRSDAQGRRALVAGMNGNRFARRFRRDVHAAASAELVQRDNNTILKLTQLDGTVNEYRPRADGVDVVTLRNEKTTARESFALSGTGEFKVEPGSPMSVVFTQTTRPDHSAAGSTVGVKTRRIQAIRGKDLRFAKRESKR